jgi:hypothetical protein
VLDHGEQDMQVPQPHSPADPTFPIERFGH